MVARSSQPVGGMIESRCDSAAASAAAAGDGGRSMRRANNYS